MATRVTVSLGFCSSCKTVWVNMECAPAFHKKVFHASPIRITPNPLISLFYRLTQNKMKQSILWVPHNWLLNQTAHPFCFSGNVITSSSSTHLLHLSNPSHIFTKFLPWSRQLAWCGNRKEMFKTLFLFSWNTHWLHVLYVSHMCSIYHAPL